MSTRALDAGLALMDFCIRNDKVRPFVVQASSLQCQVRQARCLPHKDGLIIPYAEVNTLGELPLPLLVLVVVLVVVVDLEVGCAPKTSATTTRALPWQPEAAIPRIRNPTGR